MLTGRKGWAEEIGGLACLNPFRMNELYVERLQGGGGKICALTEMGKREVRERR